MAIGFISVMEENALQNKVRETFTRSFFLPKASKTWQLKSFSQSSGEVFTAALRLSLGGEPS